MSVTWHRVRAFRHGLRRLRGVSPAYARYLAALPPAVRPLIGPAGFAAVRRQRRAHAQRCAAPGARESYFATVLDAYLRVKRIRLTGAGDVIDEREAAFAGFHGADPHQVLLCFATRAGDRRPSPTHQPTPTPDPGEGVETTRVRTGDGC